LHVWHQTLVLQVVYQHHQVSVAREVTSAFTCEAIHFQEEQPEVGERQKLLLVQKKIRVQQRSQKELSLDAEKLELKFKHGSIVFIIIRVLNQLNVYVLRSTEVLDNERC
jgi:hypothetical protein